MAQLVEASVSCAKLQCSAGERTQRVDADNLLGTLVGGTGLQRHPRVRRVRDWGSRSHDV
jgi:hypothetical protein